MATVYDVVVIGAGVIGLSLARELGRYEAHVCVVDKAGDVAQGASKANSGIIHGGYDAHHGSLKATLCRRGNRMFRQLHKELNFPYKETGTLVVAFNESEVAGLQKLLANGLKNGVETLRIIDRDELLKLEPNLNPQVHAALHCAESGIASPYEYAIALAENAVTNGVELKLFHDVADIDILSPPEAKTKTDGAESSQRASKKPSVEPAKFLIQTSKGPILARRVVNCAGVFSEQIAAMVEADNFHIIARKGQYLILTKEQGQQLTRPIFQVPSILGKGIVVTPTTAGNLMLGPNAEYSDLRDVSTTLKRLKYILSLARRTLPSIDMDEEVVTSFAGIRANSDREWRDFIIEECTSVPGFINAGGIGSPGLTSSPAIALYIVQLLRTSGLTLATKPNFNPARRPLNVPKGEEFDGKIDHTDPNKNIICRCETVTEANIVDAIHRGIPVLSTDAIKWRTRAGMGPCQGNFCQPRVAALISRERTLPLDIISKRGPGGEGAPYRVDRRILSAL